jgi:hypothetical protein
MAADPTHDRRASSRLPLAGEVVGRMASGTVVPVVDLSAQGALIETYAAMRPGTVHPIRLQLGPRDEVTVQARVVRSFIHRFDNQARGEAVVLYRVAVEFRDLRPAEQQTLERALSSLRYSPVDEDDDFDTDL